MCAKECAINVRLCVTKTVVENLSTECAMHNVHLQMFRRITNTHEEEYGRSADSLDIQEGGLCAMSDFVSQNLSADCSFKYRRITNTHKEEYGRIAGTPGRGMQEFNFNVKPVSQKNWCLQVVGNLSTNILHSCLNLNLMQM